MNFSSLYFEVTHFCNQNCKHCYLDGGTHHKRAELNTEQIKDLLNRFKAQGGKFVTITGGEPFTRTDIFTILDYIENLDLSLYLATNCILLNEEKIYKLSQYKNLKLVHTSLLGSNEKEHQYISNHNSFTHILECLNLFYKYNINVNLQVTLAKDYICKMVEMADMFSKYQIKFTPIADIGIKQDRKLQEEIVLSPKNYYLFLKEYEKVKQKYGDKIEAHNLITYNELLEEINYYKDKKFYSLTNWCLVLRPNGDKSFSLDLNNKITFGSALDSIEIEEDNKLKKYINTLKEIDIDILGVAKNTTAVNYSYLQDIMLAKKQNYIE